MRDRAARVRALLDRFGQRGIAAALDIGLYAAGNLVLNVLLARAAGPHRYGLFTAVFVAYLFGATLHESVFTEPMLVFGAKESDEHRPAYLGSLLRGHLTVMVPLGAVTAVIAALTLDGDVRGTVVAAALAAPILTAGQMTSRAAYLGDRPWLPATSSSAYALAVVVGAVVLRVGDRLTPPTAFGALALAAVVGAAPVVRALGMLSHGLGAIRPIVRRHWSYGRWSAAASTIRWVPANLPIVAVSAWTGFEGASRLRAAGLFTTPALLGISAVSLLALPSFARDESLERVARRARRVATGLAAAGLVLVPAAAAIGPGLVAAVLGESFRPSRLLIVVIALIPSVTCISAVYGALLRAVERPAAVFRGSVVAAGLTLACGLPLIAWRGPEGAAIGLVISNVGMAATLVASARRLQHEAPAQAGADRGRHP